MAFALADLHLVAQGGANNLFMYKTNDTLAVVVANAYMDTARLDRGINVGDVIIVSADLDGTPAGETYIVSQSDSTNGVTLVASS